MERRKPDPKVRDVYPALGVGEGKVQGTEVR